LLTSVKPPPDLASTPGVCHNVYVADKKKKQYVDNGWPAHLEGDEHAVSELATDRTGALSPFGDLVFPLPADQLPYTHPVTVVNK
jgi:hypothetical protein